MPDPWKQTHRPQFSIPGAPFSLLMVIGDMHTNSTRGLCPPRFERTEGATILASREQETHLWTPWCKMWYDVGEFRRRYRHLLERVIVVYNGDGVDRNRHDPEGYEALTPHRQEILDLGEKVMAVARPHVDALVVNRGTPAHSGQAGEMDELLARQLLDHGWPVLPPLYGTSLSHYWPELIFDGVRMQFGHSPGIRTGREHLRGQPSNRKGFDMTSAYGRMGRSFPQFIVYSHVHYPEHSTQHPIHVYYNPAWQLHTAYVHNLGISGKQEPVGAWWFLLSQSYYQADLWSYLPQFDHVIFDADRMDMQAQIEAYRTRCGLPPARE